MFEYGKYIVGDIRTDTGITTGAVVFTENIPHVLFASLFERITGAGTLYLNMRGEVQVSGKSTSLNIVCDPVNDKLWVERALGIGD